MADNDPRPGDSGGLSARQQVVLAECVGGARPWPIIVTEHVYTERVGAPGPCQTHADGRCVRAMTLKEATDPSNACLRTWPVERLDVPIVERRERLAWPWEFPDA